ncbi:hypothetical protein [Mycobacterium sp. IDR2000157661]|uniref:hypothetical protein n=1 Tax=Mycobacterium sp. IDR2000157661 TaxID=2867005 RepID=UPI001EEBC1F1|nr:hypothetical protein [Mycobacterium sp. IDR2000157661]ULE34577.1 hypothetical protein K3G64_08205 [Mycobacterium sp. IDR2000157661]
MAEVSPGRLANLVSIDDAAVAAHITRYGYARLAGVLSADWLDVAHAAVRPYMPEDEVYELFVDRLDSSVRWCVDRVVAESQFGALLRALAARQLPGLDCDGEAVEVVLRVVTGTGDADSAPADFHYDSTVVTAIVPIVIPDGQPGRSGELIIRRDLRPYRRTVVGNAVDKARAARCPDMRAVDGSSATVVAMQPGDIYLFWGYRSFHTSMPIPAGSRRVTLILHFGTVHPGAGMRTAKWLARMVRSWCRRATGRPRYRLIDGSE